MAYRKQYEELLYQHELLLAKLSVRDHFLKTVVREVYENIGQVLSLIRVQLSSLQAGFVNGERDRVHSSGELVGQTIRELRTMCRLFYPEENFLGEQGLADALRSEIKTLYPEAACEIPGDAGLFARLNDDESLLLYSILLDLLLHIQEKGKGSLTQFTLVQKNQASCFLMDYSGKPLESPHRGQQKDWKLSPYDRVRLLGGKLQIKKTGTDTRRIKLELPTHHQI
ncbi:MAG: hypothetical protein NTW29_05410 [Bacteroidetes bacterium]|nr:hypothetical protein [Bacteroidota bacterium]